MITIENEVCHVEISTGLQYEDYKDIDLEIEFKDGPLKGMDYTIQIDIEDLKQV